MAPTKLLADADVNVRFIAANSPILQDDKIQSWDRQLGSIDQDPHLGALQPTGQPPTFPMISFNGSLEDLVEAAATAQPGAVFDLNGHCLQVRPLVHVTAMGAGSSCLHWPCFSTVFIT